MAGGQTRDSSSVKHSGGKGRRHKGGQRARVAKGIRRTGQRG